MDAVILASGLSKRMGTNIPKPLIRLLGLPIIEHTIRKLLAKNYRVIVVYHKKEIANYLRKRFSGIILIYNPEPERENGYSLYLVKDHVRGDFLLLMSDHYYGDKFFEDVKRHNRTTIYVSKFVHDAEEATKVKVRGEDVINIGKGLKDYDYYDTGFFYCKYDIFSYIDKLVKTRYKISISDIILELSKDKRVGYYVVEDFWFDIDTKDDLRVAEKFLERNLIKKEDGIVSRNLNRKISIPISKILVRYDVFTPNLITLLSFMIGIISGVFFLVKKYILAGILAQISSIIDGCDGEVARIKAMRSSFGAIFDAVLDRYADVFIMASIAISYGFSLLTSIILALAISGTIMISYTSHMTKLRPKFMSRDVRLFLIMIGSLLTILNKNLLLYMLFLIGIFSHIDVIFMIFRKKKAI